MTTLVGYIFIWLFLSGLVGFFVGWVGRGIAGLIPEKPRHAEIDSLTQAQSEKDQRIRLLESTVAQLQGKNSDLHATISTLETELDELAAKLNQEKPHLIEGHEDDLSEIRGVGPKIISAMHEIGIYTFKDVALLSGRADALIREKLGPYRNRIENDDWRGQARILHREKYGEEL